MPLRYRILEEAERELFAAAAHIEAEREGFGMKLFDELDAVMAIALATKGTFASELWRTTHQSFTLARNIAQDAARQHPPNHVLRR